MIASISTAADAGPAMIIVNKNILKGILNLVTQIENDEPSLGNEYQRAVTSNGNEKAVEVLNDVFLTGDAYWRGLGVIANSGLEIREKYKKHNAAYQFDIKTPEPEKKKGCICGEILTGFKTPPDCPLYKKTCTPLDPFGPCMVSTEGTCAAYYRFYK